VSEALPQSGWWSSLRQPGGVARGDIAGGITAAMVLPAIEGSYGLVAFSPLGPEQAHLGFLLGAFAAAIACIVSALAGGRGPLLSGSSAALALLMATLFGWLAADPTLAAADGRPFLPWMLAYAALGLVLAGIMQVVVARLKLGGLVRYIPYPVHAGYMNGVAVLMVAAILPHILGLPFGSTVQDWRETRWLAPVVALTALLIALRPPAWTRAVPAYLTGLLAATALHHVASATPLAPLLGALFEPPAFTWPEFDTLAPLADHISSGLLFDKAKPLLLFAAAVAMMSSLQTALAGSTIDELTRTRRDSDRELLAQGVANIAVGVIGALPSAGSTTRSKLNLDAGGKTGMSRLVFGVSMLLALAFGLRFMNMVPMAAIAGVFTALAISLVDDWTRTASFVLWRQGLKRPLPRSLAASYAVMALVAGVTIFVSLPLAIGLGTLAAMVMFIRSNCKRPIRQVAHGDRRRSRKVRAAAETERLNDNASRIALVELDGALFFGTAEAADEEIEHLAQAADYIVLDFERVSEVDASGARVLLHAANAVRRAGKQLLLSGLSPRDGRMRTIRDMDVHEHLEEGQFFVDADRALEFAEDRLLATLAPAAADGAPLPLEQTLFGTGLNSQELAVLRNLLTERHVPRGEAVFRSGEPGNAMYVLLAGQIGIWLPGSDRDSRSARDRRMVSYAPGVVFGEIGLLEGRPRSADAIAESDALLLELTQQNYERLAAEHPALVGKLLLNIGLLLASRVRALTDELRSEQSAR
jgi:SulP family sulfate permease